MKATLEFNLPEDNDDFKLATKGKDWWNVCWEMDQWLRTQYKYMPDEEYSKEKYETYEKCREHLREIMFENGVSLDDVS